MMIGDADDDRRRAVSSSQAWQGYTHTTHHYPLARERRESLLLEPRRELQQRLVGARAADEL